MQRFRLLSSVFAICWFIASSAMAQHVAYKMRQPELTPPAAPLRSADDSYTRKDAEPSPSDKPATQTPAYLADMTCDGEGCSEPACGCESGCCNSCGCGGGCGWGSCLCCDCDLGEAWTLSSCLTPCCECGPTYGGWVAFGYYNDNERLSTAPNDLLAFLDNPDHLNLDQAWFYVEKLAKTDSCCYDIGYRFDILYGVDAQKTQAFGNEQNVWDVSLDHGSYGWAMPQAYAEVGYNDWSVKVGHFYTIEGYEVVQAPLNFFYSHSLMFFNSEPLTHTGVLATNTANEKVIWYAGWTLGWDTGFDQFGNGNCFLGGVGLELTDDVKFTYICSAGDFGLRGDGYNHTNVLDMTLSKCWHYILQSDYVITNGTVADTANTDEEVGVNQYLIYTLNDCWSVGGRMEWWKSNSVTGFANSYQELTGGINYKPHANVVIRPEIRYNWTNESVANNTQDFNNTVFGIDAVFTY